MDRWGYIKDWFYRLYSKNIYGSLPWLFLCLGTTFILLGVANVFKNPVLNRIFSELGKAIFSGGILSLLLKSMQFLGIVKEELAKIISSPDYLRNRHDLEEYWDKVTCVLFENKFPAINDLITKNIKRVYLPTKEIHYYENSLEILNIDLIDTEANIVQIVQNTSFTVIPSKIPYSSVYPYKIEIQGTAEYKPTFSLDHVKINDEEKIYEPSIIDAGNNLVAGFNLEIKGEHSQYVIQYQITRTFPLSECSVLTFKNNNMHHNQRVHIFFKNVKVAFYEAGIIGKFKTIYETSTIMEKEFVGLLYKGQGFMIILEKN